MAVKKMAAKVRRKALKITHVDHPNPSPEMAQQKMLEYIDTMRTRVENQELGGIYVVSETKGGGYHAAMIGNFDIFSLMGFSLFAQMSKIQQTAEISEDVAAFMKRASAVIQ